MSHSRSDELLRTFAAVPVDSTVLVYDAHAAPHGEVLLQLGFTVDLRVPGAVTEAAEQRLIATDANPARWAVQSHEASLPLDRYDWIVWQLPPEPPTDAGLSLKRFRSALRPGGWCYVCTPGRVEALKSAPEGRAASYSPEVLADWAAQADLAEAVAPRWVVDEASLHAIYRRVEADTPL